MKTRPILFSAPMVRALLDGRKTQTRRIVKPQPTYQGFDGPPTYDSFGEFSYPAQRGVKCPYGIPGDRLWVRETWRDDLLPPHYRHIGYLYRADPDEKDDKERPWRPSIFMPRAASRITLEIVSVRVERLREISHEDAMGEGMAWDDAVYDYSRLWESLNGPGSWDANPFVWCVEFRMVEA
jgi:hypothetical protein